MLSSRHRLRERVSAGVGLCRQWRAEPVLFRLLVETAISGTDAPVPALERDYVRAIRAELSVEEVADVLWSMNSPELYLLLVGQCGWDPDRYQRWLADAWQRLLLRPA